MSLRISATIAVLLSCVAGAACSGSDDSQVPTGDPAANGQLAPPTGDPSAENGAAPSGGSEAPAPSGGGGTTSGDGGAGSGGGGGGGTGTGGGTGGGGGTGTKCAAGAPVEKEGNDTPDVANPIPAATGSFCGSLSSKTDVDYVTFTLPADAVSLAFGSDYSKVGVEFEVTVEGESFLVGNTPKIKPGKSYVIKAFTTGVAPVDYRLSVNIGK